MRCIGHLDNQEQARTFSDFLYVEGIANQVEDDPGHGWAVWVSSEDELARAGDWLAKFRRQPTDPRYRQKARQADRIKQQEVESDAEYARKIKDRRQVFRPVTGVGSRPLTVSLIAISVLVFLGRNGSAKALLDAYLSFSQFPTGLPEIMQGQLWRLITPIFIHFDWLHILFNLLWLWDLGGMIENRLGPAKLAVILVGLAVVSNAAQYFGAELLLQAAEASGSGWGAAVASRSAEMLGSGLNFGGLSGVNYGLLSYIWMRGRHDPDSGLFLNPQSLMIMLVWFVLCFTPIFGHIANGCHLAGLALGAAWGWQAAQRPR
jgi:GlpG protein